MSVFKRVYSDWNACIDEKLIKRISVCSSFLEILVQVQSLLSSKELCISKQPISIINMLLYVYLCFD